MPRVHCREAAAGESRYDHACEHSCSFQVDAAVAAAICSASARRWRGTSMRVGALQDWPLLQHKIIDHAALQYGGREVVTRSIEGPIHRTNYRQIRERALRVAQALTRDGIKLGDRVATGRAALGRQREQRRQQCRQRAGRAFDLVRQRRQMLGVGAKPQLVLGGHQRRTQLGHGVLLLSLARVFRVVDGRPHILD